VLDEPTLHDELDTKIMRGSAWALLGFGGTNVLSFVTTIILARLLVPADFGLVALTITLLAVAHLAQESGLGAALIVHKGELRRAAASVLVFSPVVAVAMYSVIFISAPLFSDVFHAPRLTDVLRITALAVPLRGLTVLPRALLERSMLFGPIAGIEIAGGLAQAVAAIGLAAAGAGVWSLVAGQLAAGLAQLVLAWVFSPLRPSPLEADWATLRQLARFGRHVGAANIINYGNSAAEGIVIGRALGTKPLGYYTLGSRLAQMPVDVLGNILGRGVYAAMAQISEDIDGVKRIWLTNLQRVALLTVPSSIGLVFAAHPLVEVMLGPSWKPAILPLQILTLNGILQTFSATSGELFQALNRAHYRVYVEIAHFVLVVPALIIGSQVRGITGVAAAVVLVNLATGLPVVVASMRLVQASPAELATWFYRPAIGWAVLTAGLAGTLPFVRDLSAPLALGCLVAVGAGLYAAAIAVFARELVGSMWLSLRGAPYSQSRS
jgi:PST family polysaccharide transporter